MSADRPGKRLAENDLSGWLPQTPLRMYYGSRDTDVSPREAVAQVADWQEEGVKLLAIDVGELNHNESVIEAVPRVLEWFSEFSH